MPVVVMSNMTTEKMRVWVWARARMRMLRMTKSWLLGRKLVIIWTTTLNILGEWKTCWAMVSRSTMKGKSERMAWAATLKA